MSAVGSETEHEGVRPKKSDAAFISGSAVYLLSNVVNAAIPFALLPILTRHLSPAEYGEVAIFLAALNGLSAFTGLNAAPAASVSYFNSSIAENERRYYIGSCFQILVVSFALVSVATLQFGEYFAKWLGLSATWLLWAVVTSAAQFTIQVRLGQWQVRKEAKKFGIFQVSQSAVNVLLSLLAVVHYNLGAAGRISAIIIAGALFAVVAAILLRRDNLLAFFSWRPTYVKEILAFGIPLIPHVFGGVLLIAFDRVAISSILGLESAGVYMVAAQLAGALAIIFDGVNKAYVPWLFEKLERNSAPDTKLIVRYSYIWFFLILLMIAAGFVLGTSVVDIVGGPRYREAASVVGWLVLGQGFGGLYLMVTNYVFFTKKTGMLSLVTLTSGAINVALLFLFLNLFGLPGAGYAFASSMVVRFFMTWWLQQRYYPMPWLSARPFSASKKQDVGK